MDDILQQACSLYERIRHAPYPPAVAPSDLWLTNIRDCLEAALHSGLADDSALRVMQARSPITCDHEAGGPLFREIVAGYRAWFDAVGAPLGGFDPLIQESFLATPQFTTLQDGRRISTTFLWHLCICQRLTARIPRRLGRVLELGSGFGGVARLLQLLVPGVRHTLLDIPETLIFAYLYLRLNFPDARVHLVTDPEDRAANAPERSDLRLVPVPFMDCLADEAFDCVVNTASLGEMTQAAVDRYLAFIENDIRTDFFYSVNRYGQYPRRPVRVPMTGALDLDGLSVQLETVEVLPVEATNAAGHRIYAGGKVHHLWEDETRAAVFRPHRSAGGNACDYSTPLDPYWRTHLWERCDGDSFSAIEPLTPPSLELLVERVPRRLLPDAQRRFLSANLLDEAQARDTRDAHWERLLWESVRLDPHEANLPIWLAYLQDAHYDEYLYFQRVEQSRRPVPEIVTTPGAPGTPLRSARDAAPRPAGS